MRPLADAGRVERFMKAVGRVSRFPGADISPVGRQRCADERLAG